MLGCGLPAGWFISHLQPNLNCKGCVNCGIMCKFILCTEYHKCLQKKMPRIPVGLPGDGEILKLSPMVSVGQIVTGAADRIPDLEGK